MSANRSRFSLYQLHCFLKLVGQERLVDHVTLDKWREAVREFGPVFDFKEAQDLRCVDIKRVSQRYIKKQIDMRTSITHWRVFTLENLLRTVLGEFIAFTVNPAQYRKQRDLVGSHMEIVAA